MGKRPLERVVWKERVDAPAEYEDRFGGTDPALALRVFFYVTAECYARYYGAVRVDVALLAFGRKSDPAFGLRRGFKLLRVGRWLNQKGWRLPQ